MTTNENINSIYAYAFTGVLLFIAAIVLVAVVLLNGNAPQPTENVIAGSLVIAAASFLYKAIKYDRYTLSSSETAQ